MAKRNRISIRDQNTPGIVPLPLGGLNVTTHPSSRDLSGKVKEPFSDDDFKHTSKRLNMNHNHLSGLIKRDVVICRCGTDSKGVDSDIHKNRYHDFVIEHWKSCHVASDELITDCLRWEKI